MHHADHGSGMRSKRLFFVNYVFQTSMERETRQALDESSILRFAFETAALNIPSKYDVLPDGTVEQIGVYLENSGQHGNRLLRISDENGECCMSVKGLPGILLCGKNAEKIRECTG